ncbi:hypothetical protein WKK05_22035 [Nostoc sp. UHCC 0302]|uniref:hypothetical protein n=1 Tax=Nostoc sp. UHCC 0302 TaxID=3134896 RepID=UPI00311CB066
MVVWEEYKNYDIDFSSRFWRNETSDVERLIAGSYMTQNAREILEKEPIRPGQVSRLERTTHYKSTKIWRSLVNFLKNTQ